METLGTVETILGHKGRNVWFVSPDTTVFDAIQRLADCNIGALPVMEGDRLAGIITERDYTRKVALKGKNSRQTMVREILSENVVTVQPSTSIEECMSLMTGKRIRHLPVVEGDEVKGIISIGDLVSHVIQVQKATISHLQSYIAGEYPG
jgi:CBS domain-containing protein